MLSGSGEGTRRLLTGAALGAAMSALALLGTGLVILASLTVDPQGEVLPIFDWPPLPFFLKGAFPSWAPRWEYAEVCAAYLPAGWLLSQLVRLRQRDIPAVQGRWSWNRNSLLLGLGTGLLVGMVFDVLLDRVAGVGWGAAAGLVSWLITTWSASPADITAVTSPRQLLRKDHKAFWTFVRTGALLGLLTGLLLGVLLGILNWDLWELDLGVEDRLPPERTLAWQLGVFRPTVHRPRGRAPARRRRRPRRARRDPRHGLRIRGRRLRRVRHRCLPGPRPTWTRSSRSRPSCSRAGAHALGRDLSGPWRPLTDGG